MELTGIEFIEEPKYLFIFFTTEVCKKAGIRDSTNAEIRTLARFTLV